MLIGFYEVSLVDVNGVLQVGLGVVKRVDFIGAMIIFRQLLLV